jgi:RNA-directed DNA polymerase
MSLSTSESVQKLRAALHAQAKGSPSYRFYALYDKVYREDVPALAIDDQQLLSQRVEASIL